MHKIVIPQQTNNGFSRCFAISKTLLYWTRGVGTATLVVFWRGISGLNKVSIVWFLTKMPLLRKPAVLSLSLTFDQDLLFRLNSDWTSFIETGNHFYWWATGTWPWQSFDMFQPNTAAIRTFDFPGLSRLLLFWAIFHLPVAALIIRWHASYGH